MATSFINTIPRYSAHPVCSYKISQRLRCLRSNGSKRNLVTKEHPNSIDSDDSNLRNFEVNCTFSNGRVLNISSGSLARLADGAATATLEDTSVMATVVSKANKTPGGQFVPLTVSYQLKAAALGRIPLTFRRREMGQSDVEILTSRMVDRSIRPLFPEGFNWDTQVVCNPLSLDGKNFPDVLCINAASAALHVSDVPWDGPVGAVQLAYVDNEVIINPTKKELARSPLNLVMVTRTKKMIVMIECSNSELLVQELLKTMKVGVKECGSVVREIENLRKACGKEKREFVRVEENQELKQIIEDLSLDKLDYIFKNVNHNKLSRDQEISNLRDQVLVEVRTKFMDLDLSKAANIFHKVCATKFRDLILDTKVRCDGRLPEEMRKVWCKVNLFKPLHGSAIFQRGQTQVMCTVALDSPNSALKMDRSAMLTSGVKEKNFFVHYDFPPYATKEISRMGVTGRREIGHGALAEKALRAVVPEKHPFTIRLTSEVLESNGSSSMATVCGGTLALLDAGVPLESPCAGVAMGIVSRCLNEEPEKDDYVILTDLLGIEDHFGDTDFKIAGTKKIFTAMQLDVKNSGLPFRIIISMIEQSRPALLTLLQIMENTCPEPRKVDDNYPVIDKIKIPPHLRSKFIGYGGVNLKKLEVDAGVEFVEDNVGEFTVFAPNSAAMFEVKELVEAFHECFKEPILQFGGIYTAKIVEVKDLGCMVTLYPNMTPTLIHTSQLDLRRVAHPSALGLEVGQEIRVKYFGRDPVSGVIRLSRKVLQTAEPSKSKR